MPSGQTHDRITLWSLPIAAGLSLAITRSSSLTLLVSGGYLFSGLMMGPDLDVRSIHFRRWGWLRWIWIPYRGSMRHRSPASHAPITGTALRVAYLLLWMGAIAFASLTITNEIGQMGWTWGDVAQIMGRSLQRQQAEWISLIVGLELGALSHYVSDWLVSSRKRIKAKGWKKGIQAMLPKPENPKPGRRKRRSPSAKPRVTTRTALKRRSKS